jgi:DNA-binding helix-turn-helix protein
VDLAYACDFEKSNMSRIEAGKTCPNIYTLYKIAQHLEINLSELVSLSVEK